MSSTLRWHQLLGQDMASVETFVVFIEFQGFRTLIALIQFVDSGNLCFSPIEIFVTIL